MPGSGRPGGRGHRPASARPGRPSGSSSTSSAVERPGSAAPTARSAPAQRPGPRRPAGGREPLQYVLGSWQFRSLELAVDRRVLIPRPETEQVVEVALAELARLAAARPDGRRPARSAWISVPDRVPSRCRWPWRGRPWARPSDGVGHRPVRWTPSRWPRQPGHRSRGSTRRGRAGVPGVRFLVRCPAPAACRPDRPGGVQPAVRVRGGVSPTSTPGCASGSPSRPWSQPRGARGVAGMADIEKVVAGAARWLRPGGALVVESAPSQAVGRDRRRPPSRIHPGADRHGIWPVGCGCWWRTGDPTRGEAGR